MVRFNKFLFNQGWKLLKDAHDLSETLRDAENTRNMIRDFNYSREWAVAAEALDKELTQSYKEISELKVMVFALNQASNAIQGKGGGDGFDDFQRLEKLLELDQLGIIVNVLKNKGEIKEVDEFITEVV